MRAVQPRATSKGLPGFVRGTTEGSRLGKTWRGAEAVFGCPRE
ncbi:hypothetical protein [Haladaptatus sp. NG-WS-4]